MEARTVAGRVDAETSAGRHPAKSKGEPETDRHARGAETAPQPEGTSRTRDEEVPQKKTADLPPAGAGAAQAGAEQAAESAGDGTQHPAAPSREDARARVPSAEDGARAARGTGAQPARHRTGEPDRVHEEGGAGAAQETRARTETTAQVAQAEGDVGQEAVQGDVQGADETVQGAQGADTQHDAARSAEGHHQEAEGGAAQKARPARRPVRAEHRRDATKAVHQTRRESRGNCYMFMIL